MIIAVILSWPELYTITGLDSVFFHFLEAYIDSLYWNVEYADIAGFDNSLNAQQLLDHPRLVKFLSYVVVKQIP